MVSWAFYGLLLVSMHFKGFLWANGVSLGFYGILWDSWAFYWLLLVSMHFIGFLWAKGVTLGFCGFLCTSIGTSIGIHGLKWVSVGFMVF